jgi:SAM-dependent methyltransferase
VEDFGPVAANVSDRWASGDAYEPYIGRWSRLVARDFLRWLAPFSGAVWLDVGCGTGALTETVLGTTAPARVWGIDPAQPYLAHARKHVGDVRAAFVAGDGRALPVRGDNFDYVVSGLSLNFVPDPRMAVLEATRVARPGRSVAAYVWDYAGRMEMLRQFWDAAAEVDERAVELDEGVRFPICDPDALSELWQEANLQAIEVTRLEPTSVFESFGDYWTPFLGGQGPAPGFVASLNDSQRAELAELLRARLPTRPDGSMALVAGALAVSGKK